MASQNQLKYVLLGLLMVTFLLAFMPVLGKLTTHWGLGDNSYCYLVIPLVLYLCWDQRHRFQFGQFSWHLWGLVPVVLSVSLMIGAELASLVTLLYVGIWALSISVVFILYGTRLRRLIFPLLISAFIVPLPPYINRLLTFNLKLAASSVSAMMLRLAGVPVHLDGNIIDLGITQMQVVDACSGLRYFVPLILMSLLFGYFFSRRLWHRGLLLIIVLPLSIIVNSFRIFITGLLHTWGYPKLADSLFHDFAGLVIFMLAATILLGVAIGLNRFAARRAATPGTDNGGKHVSSWVPIATTVILCLIFVGSGQALQHLPSADNMPDRLSFNTFPMTVGQWQGRRDYLPQKVLDNLWSDDYVIATYFSENKTNVIHLLIPFYEYQGTRHTAHAPQSCMLGGGWALIRSQERRIITDKGGGFPVVVTLWEKENTRVLGSHFFFQRGRTITSPWMNKYWLMVDALTRQRTDGALVRAELVMTPGQSLEDAHNMLESFLGQLYEILPAYVPL